MQRRFIKWFAFDCIATIVGNIDVAEERLDAIILIDLPWVLAEPFIVKSDIRRYAVSVTEEMPKVAVPLRYCRRSVIVRVFGESPVSGWQAACR